MSKPHPGASRVQMLILFGLNQGCTSDGAALRALADWYMPTNPITVLLCIMIDLGIK